MTRVHRPTFAISALQRLRQEGQEFKASLCYVVRLCLKTKQTQQQVGRGFVYVWLKKKRREEDRERYTVKTGKASRLFQELLPYVKIKHQIITAQRDGDSNKADLRKGLLSSTGSWLYSFL